VVLSAALWLPGQRGSEAEVLSTPEGEIADWPGFCRRQVFPEDVKDFLAYYLATVSQVQTWRPVPTVQFAKLLSICGKSGKNEKKA